jgi:hypothetical protein
MSDKRAPETLIAWQNDYDRCEVRIAKGVLVLAQYPMGYEQHINIPLCYLGDTLDAIAGLTKKKTPKCTDDKRALLLAFVEWTDSKDGIPEPCEYSVDAFLAQATFPVQDLPSPPATVSTSSQSSEEGQVRPGCFGVSPVPIAPHVKVTEVIGHAEWSRTRHGSEDFYILGEHESAYGLDLMLPDETLPPRLDNRSLDMERPGPRGRFRVTVEFWPEEQP